MKNYGMTLEDHSALFASQGSVCAICNSVEHGSRGWHTDHCHKKNIVRGILCHHCNIILGNAKDNTDILASAISYLKDFEARQRVN